ncbi:MAG: hypothetical protein Q4F65_01035 [Propionibacteriaceae bacterium]|nr:hypothetical protein [Propionibacteriaceae bacterium]
MAELTPGQRDALTAALHDIRADVRDRVLDYARTSWDHLGDWRDDDIARFLSAVLPQIEAGKRTIAQATDTALALMADTAPAGVTDLAGIRGGVTPAEVYQRPAVAMRSALAEGKPFADALEAGAQRLESLVKTDLQLAHTHQARATLTAPARRGARRRGGHVEAFRRVPSGSENCAMCLIASTQRYWVGDLMPIHPGCDCGVQTLGVGEHVEQVIDSDLLEAVHDQVESFTGIYDRGGREVDYRLLIVTREHGEYGPTIGWKHQKHTGPDEVEQARERVVVAEPEPESEPTSSWFFEAIKDEKLRSLEQEDLLDMYNEAAALNDPQAVAFLHKELLRRDKEESGYRGSGYSRTELRAMYAEHVERQYWAAESVTNGFMVNPLGQARGVSPRSLFRPNPKESMAAWERRVDRYATDELKEFWSQHGRWTFEAFAGDPDAIARARTVEY